MQGVEFMVKRAEDRKNKEADLFGKAIQWASEEGDTLVV
jgi:hypothetical protein